jgi:hypothetical protein
LGTFSKGPTPAAVDFDDRVLAHLRTVIVTKLRRGECFLFTWTDESGPEPVQQSLWMHPAVGLHFAVDAAAAHDLNPAWLEVLMTAAHSGFGLTVRPEPAKEATRG